MQIVIEIDENMYQKIKGMENLILKNRTFKSLELAVLEGKVLPEHHGDLVDRNSFEYLKTLNDAIYGKMSWNDALHKIRYSAPTVIPATKEGDVEC